MSRGLIRITLATLAIAPFVLNGGIGVAAREGSGRPIPGILQRFLTLDDPAPTSFRVLRHLDTWNRDLKKTAWMDVWTESAPAGGFSYVVVAQGGSGFIRSRVFITSLGTEKKMYKSGEPSRAGLTPENYVFSEGGDADGLSSVVVTPQRKDVLLIEGSIFLRPEDGELLRIEGRLSKAPSFWIRQVQIVQTYRRIAGVRLPIVVEAVASVRLFGKTTFRMVYDYEMLNGRRVGAPIPRLEKAESFASVAP